jgi:hypothetical protein
VCEVIKRRENCNQAYDHAVSESASGEKKFPMRRNFTPGIFYLIFKKFNSKKFQTVLFKKIKYFISR